VKILQDVLRQQAFTDRAELVEALKCRCARLKIRNYSRLVHLALDQLEQGGRRSLLTLPPTPPRGHEPLQTGPVVTARDAKAILETLHAHIRTMPDANR
jgi:hypothetical protein